MQQRLQNFLITNWLVGEHIRGKAQIIEAGILQAGVSFAVHP
jgi:hypothetical protein